MGSKGPCFEENLNLWGQIKHKQIQLTATKLRFYVLFHFLFSSKVHTTEKYMDMGRLVLDYNLDFANGLILAVFLVALNSPPVRYIVVQQTTTVSLTGFPVLRTLYKPMYMHKRTKSQNC